MPDLNAPKGPRSFPSLIVIAALVVLLTAAIFFADKITVFCINRFTDYKFAYLTWEGNLFKKSVMEGLRLESKKNGFVVISERSRFDLRPYQSLKQRQLIVDCKMENVLFGTAYSTVPPDPEQFEMDVATEDEAMNSLSQALADPFGPGSRYDEISFTLFLDKRTVRVVDFRAISKAIEIKAKEFTQEYK
jgi:hypothetical protein